MQLSKIIERTYYEYVNDGEYLTMTINNLTIESNNNEFLFSIEKFNKKELL